MTPNLINLKRGRDCLILIASSLKNQNTSPSLSIQPFLDPLRTPFL